MEHKSVFITGANGGLGFETSKLLAQIGFKRMVLAARTEKKAIDAKARLERETSLVGELETAGGFDMNAPKLIEKGVANLPKGKPFDIIFADALLSSTENMQEPFS